jgi:CPA2 family monovalent cation:H+ antiporter-2
VLKQDFIMEAPTFLRDLVVIFGTSVVVSYVFRVLHLSSIAGFLVAGALIGPFGLGLIGSGHEVEQIAEIGVMLLLFSIGVEFSLSKLMRMKWLALVGGTLQMVVTAGIAALIVQSVLGGILIALSSTVIALRLLHDRGQASAPQGSASLAILIFQDLAVVPVMLFLPLLAGRETFAIQSFLQTLLLSVIAVVVILAATSVVVPRLIAATVASRSRDIFILSVIFTVFGTAWLSARAGFSAALGAFVAGIVISESEYSHQVLADVLPFRETFNSLFFVAIGMMLNPTFLMDNALIVLASAGAVLVGKAVILAVIVRIFGMPFRVAFSVGLYLAQIGEFSLVVLTGARALGALSEQQSQLYLSVILVTMVVAPFLAMIGDHVTRGTGAGVKRGSKGSETSNHTVIVGYGLNGQNVAASLRSHDLPYAILEMNPQTVKAASRAGEPIFYGDAISEVVLEHVGIERAQCAAFAISDPIATRQGVAAARRLNPSLYIIARTRYIAEIEGLYAAGADTVIAEEFETSLEIVRRILGRMGYRPSVIDRDTLNIRQKRYERFRTGTIEKVPLEKGTDFEPFEVEVRTRASGKSLAELGLREQTGATIVAVRRGSEVTPNPDSKFTLAEADHVYLIGTEGQIRRAMRLL